MRRFFMMLISVLLLLSMIAVTAAETEKPEEDRPLEETVEEVTAVSALPIDFSAGHVPSPDGFSENGYEDESIRVSLERVQTDHSVYNVARIKISDPSQLRTAIRTKKRDMKISAMAEKANAIVATGGDYYGSDKGGYIVRQGEVIEKRKSPYETRDLLCVDENGDFHILLRKRDAKDKNGKTKSINPEFTDELKALTQEHTMVNVFEWGPGLVVDGVLQEIPDSYSGALSHRNPRCAIGQIGKLEYVMVVAETITHHDRSGTEGTTGEELAQFMADIGCVQAYNLDGGNSALMVFNGKNYSDKTVSEERSVSDIIYFATAVDSGLDQ